MELNLANVSIKIKTMWEHDGKHIRSVEKCDCWPPYSTLRGSGQKAGLIGKLASRLASLSIRELRRVRSRLLRGVFIVSGFCDEIIEYREVKECCIVKR